MGWGLPAQGTEGAGTGPADWPGAGRTPLCRSRTWNSPEAQRIPPPPQLLGSCGLSWAWAPGQGEGLPRRGQGQPPFWQIVSANIPAPDQPWAATGPAPVRRCPRVRAPIWVRASGTPRQSRGLGEGVHPLGHGILTPSSKVRLGSQAPGSAPQFWLGLLCWPRSGGPWTLEWTLERGLGACLSRALPSPSWKLCLCSSPNGETEALAIGLVLLVPGSRKVVCPALRGPRHLRAGAGRRGLRRVARTPPGGRLGPGHHSSSTFPVPGTPLPCDSLQRALHEVGCLPSPGGRAGGWAIP